MSELSERLKKSYISISSKGIGLTEACNLIDEIEELENADSEKQKRIEHLEAEIANRRPAVGSGLSERVRTVVGQLKDLAKDRESFFNAAGDDEIFRRGHQLLCEAADMLEVMVEKNTNVCDWHRCDNNWNLWGCSSCGAEWTLEEGTPFDNHMEFCPQCGAELATITDLYYDDGSCDYVETTKTRDEVEATIEKEKTK